jgi:hypothetical protein
MMWGGGTYTTSSTATNGNGPECRYCGCTCMGGTGCYPIQSVGNFVIVIDGYEPYRSRRELDIDAMLTAIKRDSLVSPPDWLLELHDTPRRMKRPFPRSLPGPRMIRSAPRVRHRGLRRIRRLWKHAA